MDWRYAVNNALRDAEANVASLSNPGAPAPSTYRAQSRYSGTVPSPTKGRYYHDGGMENVAIPPDITTARLARVVDTLSTALQNVAMELDLERSKREDQQRELKNVFQCEVGHMQHQMRSLQNDNALTRQGLKDAEQREEQRKAERREDEERRRNRAGDGGDGAGQRGSNTTFSNIAVTGEFRDRISGLETETQRLRRTMEERNHRLESFVVETVASQVASEMLKVNSTARESGRSAADDAIQLRLDSLTSLGEDKLHQMKHIHEEATKQIAIMANDFSLLSESTKKNIEMVRDDLRDVRGKLQDDSLKTQQWKEEVERSLSDHSRLQQRASADLRRELQHIAAQSDVETVVQKIAFPRLDQLSMSLSALREDLTKSISQRLANVETDSASAQRAVATLRSQVEEFKGEFNMRKIPQLEDGLQAVSAQVAKVEANMDSVLSRLRKQGDLVHASGEEVRQLVQEAEGSVAKAMDTQAQMQRDVADVKSQMSLVKTELKPNVMKALQAGREIEANVAELRSTVQSQLDAIKSKTGSVEQQVQTLRISVGKLSDVRLESGTTAASSSAGPHQGISHDNTFDEAHPIVVELRSKVAANEARIGRCEQSCNKANTSVGSLSNSVSELSLAVERSAAAQSPSPSGSPAKPAPLSAASSAQLRQLENKIDRCVEKQREMKLQMDSVGCSSDDHLKQLESLENRLADYSRQLQVVQQQPASRMTPVSVPDGASGQWQVEVEGAGGEVLDKLDIPRSDDEGLTVQALRGMADRIVVLDTCLQRSLDVMKEYAGDNATTSSSAEQTREAGPRAGEDGGYDHQDYLLLRETVERHDKEIAELVEHIELPADYGGSAPSGGESRTTSTGTDDF